MGYIALHQHGFKGHLAPATRSRYNAALRKWGIALPDLAGLPQVEDLHVLDLLDGRAKVLTAADAEVLALGRETEGDTSDAA